MTDLHSIPDDVLLHRFVEDGSEDAFGEILRRYGPLVHGVCRRYLHDASDRDDAWQATFFLLARKAASIRRGGALATWLHGTARRVCLLSLRRAARRPATLNRPATTNRLCDAAVLAEAREAATVLEEELTHLPARYRAPLLLSCLHGLARSEIVTRLGLPIITVTGRLARGKALLRSRLTRRGVVPAVTASLLSGAATLHAWPTDLNTATLAAATQLRIGQTTSLAPKPLALMKGVLTMTTLQRLQWTGLLLVIVVGATLGSLAFLPLVQADDQPQAGQVEYSDPELARDYAALQGRWIERASFSTRYTSAQNTILPGWTTYSGSTRGSQSPYFDSDLQTTFRLEKTPTGKVMAVTMKFTHPADKSLIERTDRYLYSLDGDLLIQTSSGRDELPKKIGQAGNDRIHNSIYQRLMDTEVQAIIQRAGGQPRIQVAKDLRGIAIAMHNYHSDHAQLPQVARFGPDGKPLLSWRVLILPYLGQKALFDQFKLDEPWDSPNNKSLIARIPKIYLHPEVDKVPANGLTHYQVFTNPARPEAGRSYQFAPPFSLDSKFKLSLQELTKEDGTSNTVLLAEARQGTAWTKPEDMVVEHDGATLPAVGAVPNGTDFFTVFCDGSVRPLRRMQSEKDPGVMLLRQEIGYKDGWNYDTSSILR